MLQALKSLLSAMKTLKQWSARDSVSSLLKAEGLLAYHWSCKSAMIRLIHVGALTLGSCEVMTES
jgi:hypothetical protein